jgi:hypothetical protein
MMKIGRGIAIAACGAVFTLVLGLAALSANAQDLTMHSTETSSGMMGKGGETTTSTEYYSENAIRMNPSSGRDTMILLGSGKIINIDNKNKTYSEMTFDELNDMLKKAGEQLNANSEQMAAAMKMMGLDNTDVSLTKVGPGETIAGYPTDKYLLKGFLQMEIMAAPDLKIPSAYYDVMKMQMPPNPIMDFGKIFDEMKKIDGFPLKYVTTIKMMNMEVKAAREVTSVEKGDIPASVFEIPADYKRVEPKLNQ